MIVIKKDELPGLGEYKYFDFPEIKDELLVYVDGSGALKIFSSFCPHFGGPLSIKDGNLFCWFHEYIYDIETGSCLNRGLATKCREIKYKYIGEGVEVAI